MAGLPTNVVLGVGGFQGSCSFNISVGRLTLEHIQVVLHLGERGVAIAQPAVPVAVLFVLEPIGDTPVHVVVARRVARLDLGPLAPTRAPVLFVVLARCAIYVGHAPRLAYTTRAQIVSARVCARRLQLGGAYGRWRGRGRVRGRDGPLLGGGEGCRDGPLLSRVVQLVKVASL